VLYFEAASRLPTRYAPLIIAPGRRAVAVWNQTLLQNAPQDWGAMPSSSAAPGVAATGLSTTRSDCIASFGWGDWYVYSQTVQLYVTSARSSSSSSSSSSPGTPPLSCAAARTAVSAAARDFIAVPAAPVLGVFRWYTVGAGRPRADDGVAALRYVYNPELPARPRASGAAAFASLHATVGGLAAHALSQALTLWPNLLAGGVTPVTTTGACPFSASGPAGGPAYAYLENLFEAVGV
jgi:hypothetical protein